MHYPASSPGQNAPLLRQAGGYPVVVFLHGFGVTGVLYQQMGEMFAGSGYVAVLQNTGQSSATQQFLDAVALHPSLVAENTRSGSFFRGALDMNRAALAGHSMGGGSTIRVLASSAGYRAGVCFAPWTVNGYQARYAPSVQVPLAIVHGLGDQVLPWELHSQAFYQAATSFTGSKLLYLLDESCNHSNVAGLTVTTPASRLIWARTSSMAVGFLDHYVAGAQDGLEDVYGPAARQHPNLVRFDIDVESPAMWLAGGAAPGSTAKLGVLSLQGPAAMLAAAGRAAIPTPFGTLLLDPASLVIAVSAAVGPSLVLEASLPIPPGPALVGAVVPLQSAGIGASGLGLTSSPALVIE